MSDIETQPPVEPKPRIAADRGALFATLVHLWPYIWPADRRDLKLRGGAAMGRLLLAKVATLADPVTFKWATEALVGQGSAPRPPADWLASGRAAPLVVTVAPP